MFKSDKAMSDFLSRIRPGGTFATHEKWTSFTKRPIANAHKAGKATLVLSCDSRDAVNAMVEAGARAGGVADADPVQDFGFMLNRHIEDPDGHVREGVWMDPNAIPPRC